MAMQFDVAELAVKILAPNNKLIYDDKGLPSVMVEIPKLKIKDLIDGGPDIVHPAFKVNGVEKDSIFISKYQNVVNNGRAYSLPGMDPRSNITFNAADEACSAKGDGWHVITAAEWALLALICKKNGFLPYGNNNYGKDSRETMYKAIPTTYDSQNRVNHVRTGTGPLTWSHNGAIDGIWDLNGNVSEWISGMRYVYGELQLIPDSNAADRNISKAADSSAWKALDASTGEFITPNGLGTTENSVKISLVGNVPTFTSGTIIQSQSNFSKAFKDIACDETIGDEAKAVMKALAIIPDTTEDVFEGDIHYFNNITEERVPCCGGHYGNGAGAGVFCCSAYGRSYSVATLGFRSAYCEL